MDEGIKRRFRKPTLSQLEIFFQEKKIPATEAQRFFNHFESNGWKVGGISPMKDWKAAGRNWILNISRYGPKTDMKDNTNNYLSTTKIMENRYEKGIRWEKNGWMHYSFPAVCGRCLT